MSGQQKQRCLKIKSHQTAKNGPRMLSYFVPVGKKIKNKNAMCSRPATSLDVQSCCYAVKMSLFFFLPPSKFGTETILTEVIDLKTRISLWMNSDCKQWLRTLRTGSTCEKKPESMTSKSRFVQWQL